MKYCLRKKKLHVQFTRNSEKIFAEVKKVSEILERTHDMKNHWTKYRRASLLSNSAQVRKYFE